MNRHHNFDPSEIDGKSMEVRSLLLFDRQRHL